MNVSLTPELRAFVAQKVESGLYQSASEVVREGLRALAKMDARPGFQVESSSELTEKLQQGLNSLDEGKGLTAKDVFAEIADLSAQQ